jgi:hypothetical protein
MPSAKRQPPSKALCKQQLTTYTNSVNKYRLLLQTRTRLYIVASADIIGELGPAMQRWFSQTAAGRSVYDDQVQAVMLYVYDPMTNSYQRRGSIPASSRQAAINSVMGFVGVG